MRGMLSRAVRFKRSCYGERVNIPSVGMFIIWGIQMLFTERHNRSTENELCQHIKCSFMGFTPIRPESSWIDPQLEAPIDDQGRVVPGLESHRPTHIGEISLVQFPPFHESSSWSLD